jgi:hypothetical protein
MTSNYPMLPEMQMPGWAPGIVPGTSLQDNYDLLRGATTINPALDLAGMALGGPAAKVAGKGIGMLGRLAGRYGDELAGLFNKGKRAYEGPPAGPMGGGQAALGPDVPMSNMGPDDFLNPDDYARYVDEMGAGPMPPPQRPGGLSGQEAMSGHPTLPMEPPPSNFAPGQMPPPLGLDDMASYQQRGFVPQGTPPGQVTPGLGPAVPGAAPFSPAVPGPEISRMATSQPSLGGMPPEANALIKDAIDSGMSVEQAVEWVMQMYRGMGG